jgi:hypothetical protein
MCFSYALTIDVSRDVRFGAARSAPPAAPWLRRGREVPLDDGRQFGVAEGLREDGPVPVRLREAFGAVPGDEDERRPRRGERVGDRADGLAAQVDVQQRPVEAPAAARSSALATDAAGPTTRAPMLPRRSSMPMATSGSSSTTRIRSGGCGFAALLMRP